MQNNKDNTFFRLFEILFAYLLAIIGMYVLYVFGYLKFGHLTLYCHPIVNVQYLLENLFLMTIVKYWDLFQI